MVQARTASGQSLVEFLLAMLIVIPTAVGVATLFWTQWVRFRCAYEVFQDTHARLVGGVRAGRAKFPEGRITVVETATTVRGVGVCRGMTETVELKKLDAIAW